MRTAPFRIAQTFTVTPAARDLADQIMPAIDSVHGIGSLARLVFDYGDLPYGWQGQFDPYTRTVTVSNTARFPLSNSTHELGHALDAVLLVHASGLGLLDGPITRYASEYGAGFSRGLLIDWFDAVIQSRPIHDFRMARQRVSSGTDHYETALYYLDPKEIWARCYEQFIAHKTREVALRREFRDKRALIKEIGDRKVRVYWTHREFAPISREIETVFRTLGWM